MDVIALSGKEERGDGAVDSTTHTEQDGWTRHSGGIVLGRMAKGLEVWCAYFISMESEVVDVFGSLGMLFDPTMGSHIAHAMKMCPVLNGNGGCSDISDQYPLFQNLDSFCGRDRAVDFPAGQQCASRNDSLHDSKLADDQGSGCMYLAFELSVYADGAIEIDDSFEFNAFPEKGEIVVVA